MLRLSRSVVKLKFLTQGLETEKVTILYHLWKLIHKNTTSCISFDMTVFESEKLCFLKGDRLYDMHICNPGLVHERN